MTSEFSFEGGGMRRKQQEPPAAAEPLEADEPYTMSRREPGGSTSVLDDSQDQQQQAKASKPKKPKKVGQRSKGSFVSFRPVVFVVVSWLHNFFEFRRTLIRSSEGSNQSFRLNRVSERTSPPPW